MHFGEIEIRTSMDYKEEFALYPYEELESDVQPLKILKDNQAY